VDLDEEAIEIQDTKFFKSRRLPLSSSVMAALRDYLEARRKAGAPEKPNAPLFWHQKGGYSYSAAGALLKFMIRRAGLHPDRGRGPRLHDLRHTFVVHRMTAWYQQGINPQNRLPYLAAYLGHRNIYSTLVYLTVTQELLQHANERFRAAEADVLKVIQGEP
jgi:integrase/recombinase XerD